jgi:hypothetical protein
MTAPVRLRFERKKGFSLKALSRATNGLDAVLVTRASRWGNPFKVEDWGQEKAVELYERKTVPTLDLAPLAGKNVACYCRLTQVCHPDVLLRLANRTWDQAQQHGPGPVSGVLGLWAYMRALGLVGRQRPPQRRVTLSPGAAGGRDPPTNSKLKRTDGRSRWAYPRSLTEAALMLDDEDLNRRLLARLDQRELDELHAHLAREVDKLLTDFKAKCLRDVVALRDRLETTTRILNAELIATLAEVKAEGAEVSALIDVLRALKGDPP